MKVKIPTDFERKKKLEAIQNLRKSDRLSIEEACAKVGISMSSYYKWKKKFAPIGLKKTREDEVDLPKRIPETKISEEDGNKILEVKATFPHMGTKQLRLYMIRNHKITYSFRQVRQFLELHQVPKLKSVFPPQPCRRFERDKANEMWQIDIMNFFVGFFFPPPKFRSDLPHRPDFLGH